MLKIGLAKGATIKSGQRVGQTRINYHKLTWWFGYWERDRELINFLSGIGDQGMGMVFLKYVGNISEEFSHFGNAISLLSD